MHDANMGRELGELVPLPGGERKVVDVVRQLDARALVLFNERHDRLQVGEERPVGRARGVHRFNGDRYVGGLGEWQQFVDRRTQEPSGMTKSVIISAPGIDYEAAGIERSGQS